MPPTGTAAGIQPRRFRVALSFPGEHRELVESVAVLLAGALGTKSAPFMTKWCEKAEKLIQGTGYHRRDAEAAAN